MNKWTIYKESQMVDKNVLRLKELTMFNIVHRLRNIKWIIVIFNGNCWIYECILRVKIRLKIEL